MAKLTGITAFSDHMTGLSAGLGNLTDALLAGGRDVARTAIDDLEDGAISGPGHVPSVAPDAPNSDSHFLAQSIHVEEAAPNRVLIIADTPYAAAQEFGNSRLPERPYMRPALARNRENITNRVKAAVNVAAAR